MKMQAEMCSLQITFSNKISCEEDLQYVAGRRHEYTCPGRCIKVGWVFEVMQDRNIVTSDLQCHKFLAGHASKSGVVQ